MQLKHILAVLCAAIPFAAAAHLDCSVKAKKNTSKADMSAMAKVKDEAARRVAVDKVAAGSLIAQGGLEVEEGCLVYVYDLKVPGKGGYQEVFVDAGTGAVLKVENESAARERAEQAEDKVKGIARSIEKEAVKVEGEVTGRAPGTDK